MKYFIKYSVFSFLLIFTCFYSTHASQYQNINRDDGLPSDLVRQVIEDNDGFIWLATYDGIARFDGYRLKLFTEYKNQELGDISNLLIDSRGTIWISSVNNGLYYFENGQLNKLDINNDISIIYGMVLISSNELILATDAGLWLFSTDYNNFEAFQLSEKEEKFIQIVNESMLLVSDGVFTGFFNLKSMTFNEVSLDSPEPLVITALYVYSEDSIWLGSKNGLLKYDKGCHCFNFHQKELNGKYIKSLLINESILWVGTLFDGLYQIDLASKSVIRLMSNDLSGISNLSDNNVFSLYISSDNLLWVGTFRGGVDYRTLHFHDLGAVNKLSDEFSCSLSNHVYGFYKNDNDGLIVATEKGLVQILQNPKKCRLFLHDPNNENTLSSNVISSVMKDDSGRYWVANLSGVDIVDFNSGIVNRLADETPSEGVLFVKQINKTLYLMGSYRGLYLYNETNKKSHLIVSEYESLNEAQYFDVRNGTNGNIFFSTNKGLVLYKDGVLEPFEVVLGNGDKLSDISAFTTSFDNGFWVAGNKNYFIHLELNGSFTDYSELIKNIDEDLAVYGVIQQDNDVLWLSSNKGMIKLNFVDGSYYWFKSIDGIQGDEFFKLSNYVSEDNRIYFGGRNGFNAFYPSSVRYTNTPPDVIITSFKQLGKEINSGETLKGGFALSKELNSIESLKLNHMDKGIEIEFSALNYADVKTNTYLYRLVGFNENWSEVKSDNRRATYTNLNAGDYELQVKAVNKNKVWSTQPKTLKITVKPAPWFSPWAYALYVFSFFTAVVWFIRHRTASARQRAVELEAVVTERTQELKTQKQMVESLLDHKNELFANVTHEFKTPLALIKGPTEQLLAESDLYPHKAKLNMVMRNANRLLVMVGQILKLSEVEQDKVVVREYQNIKPVLDMLFESFKPLAADKNITLQLENSSTASIYGTPELLEMVVGNLLSNAIKYTQTGGLVTLSSRDQDGQVIIEVSDTGAGIAAEDQDIIFNRFTRLDSHRDIQGTGIGLAVVKEITQANGGQIRLSSEMGRGSTFSVQLNAVENVEEQSHESELLTELVSNTHNEMRTVQSPQITKRKTHDITILVIEDNLDMQTHIGDVLAKHFDCLFADRGKQGIAMALKAMPDIVICDVMMPGMDGFQVTRILRNDANTSHIPVVLLTALNTKESRIKGWRENIDVYLTKPFDGKELQATIHAILSVRKILQQKTQASLSVAGTTEALDLPAQDLKFINKLKTVIADNYQDPMFMRPQIASLLAVSERQLQRKVKALIDESPMSLLRSYRLEMAANKLNDGFQVSIVGDECGFSSVSYFAACFKKKYGMTPKKYQMLKK